MTPRFRRPPRGFTLIELMVGSVTTTIILGAVALTVLAVQGSYQTESRIKVAVEGARTATSFIEQRLRLASYGVDPRFAFDFDTGALGADVKSNQVLEFGAGVPQSVTDDLALRYRDPAWLRKGTYVNGSVTLVDADTFGTDLPEGKRIIVACRGGGHYVVLRTLAGGVGNGDHESGNFALDTTMSTVGAGEGCLSRGGESVPSVMLMHELRIRVMDLGGRPFLMAFSNLNDLDTANAVPLAADVESFQVAYVMNRPPPGSAHAAAASVDATSNPVNWVLGDVGSAAADRTPDPTASPVPRFSTSYDDASRYNAHPANIRAVRVSITVRSTSAEPNGRRAFPRINVEDSTEQADADGYYRTTMTTTVRVPNMLSRSDFVPEVGSGYTTGNEWGG